MKKRIEQLLTESLKPVSLEIHDDSRHHAGHNEAAKKGGTHFTVKIISDEFRGKTAIQRHRMVYKILEVEIKQQIHALVITALTPDEIK